jgi:hypothetical protein
MMVVSEFGMQWVRPVRKDKGSILFFVQIEKIKTE